MTKQEKIKEAYNLINAKNLYPRPDGYSVINSDSKFKKEMVFIKEELCTDIFPNDSVRKLLIPLQLIGIEDNNGWHCLSEKDFPEDELTVLWYSDKTNEFENASLLHCDFNFEEYTHWHYLPTKAPIY